MKKTFEEPNVSVEMMAIEDAITRSGNTGPFDGEWVTIGGK